MQVNPKPENLKIKRNVRFVVCNKLRVTYYSAVACDTQLVTYLKSNISFGLWACDQPVYF